jgi:hypothetical protein
MHRAIVDGEDHRIALRKGHHLGTTLHAGSLLGQNKFAADKIAAGLG